jgi:DNA-binding SARP family transcriptional activator
VIEVSLLGPPRVERDGALLAFDTRKAVALLAHLALTDRARPRDALADLLWPGADPERARGALRRTLTSLRNAVGTEAVEATRDHVRLLRGERLTVDVDRFRALRTSGDLPGAVEVFRGEFLEGFAVRDAPDFEDWVRVEGEGLARELSGALADLVTEREAAGDTSTALQAARRWLALDPLHEPAHRALITLFARSGDRAAALTQYRECVRTLSRELGVPPLAETTALYDAVNSGSFDPGAPTAATVGSPGPVRVPVPVLPPFVGRADHLRDLLDAYGRVGPDGRVAVIAGEPGIGKTRLADELVSAVGGGGGQALVVRAHEDEASLAYAPLVEALRARVRADATWLASLDHAARAQAGRLVPELLAPGGARPEVGLDGPGAEARFLAGVWDAVVAACGRAGTAGAPAGVLVVDDLQWADDATVALLAYGLRRLGGRPVLVVLTWRTPFGHPVRRTATEAARTGGGTVCLPDRLGPEQVAELVALSRPGDADPEFAARLWERTEGVPLMLVEYLRSSVPASPDLPLPDSVRDVLRARLEPVSETGRQILSAAAVTGRSFAVDTVRAVSGRADEEAVTALEELVRRGLVREGPTGYDFAHEQLRSLVYEDTSLARRRLLHGRAATAPGTPVGAAARHLHLAGRDDEAARAHWDAARSARRVYAHAEALDHLRAAAALGHPDRVAVLTSTADVHTVLGDYPAALQTLQEAAAVAGPDELAGVEHRLGRLQHRRGEWALAEAHLLAALAALAAVSPDDTAARARVTADLSLAVDAMGDPGRAGALAREAATVAERAGDDLARCQAHNLLGMLATGAGDLASAVAELTRSRSLAEASGDADLRVAALNNLALAYREGGDLDSAAALTSEALQLCAGIGDRHREAALHNNLADLLHAAGRPDEAMAHLKTAVAIFAEIGEGDGNRAEVWQLVRW